MKPLQDPLHEGLMQSQRNHTANYFIQRCKGIHSHVRAETGLNSALKWPPSLPSSQRSARGRFEQMFVPWTRAPIRSVYLVIRSVFQPSYRVTWKNCKDNRQITMKPVK